MLPYHVVEHFLAYALNELRAIILELRNLVALVAPDATEDIRYNGLVYYFGGSGGPVSAGICGVGLKPGYVRLHFPHGAFIPDPKGLLKGTGKAMRFIHLEKYDDIPWDDIQALIEEHANFDPRSLTIR